MNYPANTYGIIGRRACTAASFPQPADKYRWTIRTGADMAPLTTNTIDMAYSYAKELAAKFPEYEYGAIRLDTGTPARVVYWTGNWYTPQDPTPQKGTIR